MKFIKDLLFFELNTTGQDPDKDSVIQLSAILLDKDNLLEKANFNSFIRVSFLDSIINQHCQMLHTEFEILKKSPKLLECLRSFSQKFGTDFLLATHNINNVLFLRNSFKRAVIKFEYDQHVLELWTLGYIYTLNYGIKKMPTLNTFLTHFRLTQERPWDSMERVRLEADIFRKIIKEA